MFVSVKMPLKPFNIGERIKTLKQRAIEKYGSKEDLHMGHYQLAGLYGDPEYVVQIDAATEERQTNLEVAAYSTKLANAMHKSGLKPGDHVVILGRNNIWVTMPLLACHYNGYATCPIDPFLPQRELEPLFGNIRPKIVFCSTTSVEIVQKVLKFNNLNVQVVTLDISDASKYNLNDFIKEYNGSEEEFKPATFDQKETTSWLLLTSGTTGIPKVIVVPFENVLLNIFDSWKNTPVFIDRFLNLSSLQWLTGMYTVVSSALFGWTRIQTSAEATLPHAIQIINKYKPQFGVFLPYMLRHMLQEKANPCDMSSFAFVGVGGAAVDNDLMLEFKNKYKNTAITILYGLTESFMPPFKYVPNQVPLGALGVAQPQFSYKLVDDDGNEINEPHKIGELWWKGARFFKGYLNNPEETAEIMTPDGWLKTGDLLSRDENDFYYYHERIKLLFRYKGYVIAPVQIEQVIKKHPKVFEAVVVGIPSPDCISLTTAAVKINGGEKVDPSEIFALVKEELPPHKQLLGGLFFVDEFPLNSTGKIKRPEVLKLALEAKRIIL